MKTTEGNKLIAEFMGSQFIDPPITDNNPYYGIPALKGIFPLISMQFHCSWDWLMPVVSKCYEYGELGSDHRQTIEESLLGIIDIEQTYTAVIEFIKWHNTQ